MSGAGYVEYTGKGQGVPPPALDRLAPHSPRPHSVRLRASALQRWLRRRTPTPFRGFPSSTAACVAPQPHSPRSATAAALTSSPLSLIFLFHPCNPLLLLSSTPGRQPASSPWLASNPWLPALFLTSASAALHHGLRSAGSGGPLP